MGENKVVEMSAFRGRHLGGGSAVGGERSERGIGRDKGDDEDEDDIMEFGRVLLGRLSGETTDLLARGIQEIRQGQKSRHIRLNEGELQRQREIVRQWDDDRTVAFLEWNKRSLEKRPELLLACYERASGRMGIA